MPKTSDGCRQLPENAICGVLRLGGSVDHELSLIPKLLQPAGDVCRLILRSLPVRFDFQRFVDQGSVRGAHV
jgi:hypothetical protein